MEERYLHKGGGGGGGGGPLEVHERQPAAAPGAAADERGQG